MSEELTMGEILVRLAELAFARPDDAVRLAMEPEAGTQGLDLRLVSEIKRGQNGSVELKLLDREKLLGLLTELMKPAAGDGAAELYTAIDRAAEKLGDGNAL